MGRMQKEMDGLCSKVEEYELVIMPKLEAEKKEL